MLGEENKKRLENVKIDIKNTKDTLVVQEQNKAEIQLQEEKLIEQYKKVFEKNQKYKKEIENVKTQNIKIARKIESRQFELENLQELLFPEKSKKPRDFN